MSSTMMALGVTLKAYDQMTGGLRSAGKAVDGLRGKINALRMEAEKFGRGAMADGLIAGGTLLKPVQAFSELEDASTRLRATMMDKNGMTGAFTQVNDLAIKLGNKLPGTTADFVNMMQALKAQGISDESILNGVGESAANLAVLLKMPSDEAAIFAAKMKVATGTADKDMLGLMDTIQRLNFMGITSGEMGYAFGKSSGALKTLKIQGLEASKALAPIFGMMIKNNLSGETVGTGFASILGNMADKKKLGSTNKMLAGSGIKLDFFDKGGNFKGVDNMVAQLDKLKNLNPVQLNAVLKELTGGGQDQQMVAILINEGMQGYKKIVADMEKQASLQKRVNAQLGTLANLWEAATGTFTNTLAAFAETFAPEIKTLTEWFGKLSEKLQGFIKTHPTLAKWIGIAIGGFAIAAIAAGALAIAFAGVLKYFALVSMLAPVVSGVIRVVAGSFRILTAVLMFAGRALLIIGRALLMNPIGLAIVAIAGGAYLIYKYWEPIKEFFKNLWSGAVDSFKAAVQMISDLMPDWLKTWIKKGVTFATAGLVNLDQPTATPVKQNGQNLNGTLTVKVDSDGRVTGTTLKTNQPGIKANVSNGLYMFTDM